MLVEKLLAVVVYVQHDVAAAAVALGVVNLVCGAAVAAPLHGLGPLAVAAGDYLDLLAHHERRVEAQSEVAYYVVGVVLVFLEEVVDAREGYLVDILVNLFLGHADAPVADGYGAGLLVYRYAHGQVAQLALEVAVFGQCLHLLRGVYGV